MHQLLTEQMQSNDSSSFACNYQLEFVFVGAVGLVLGWVFLLVGFFWGENMDMGNCFSGWIFLWDLVLIVEGFLCLGFSLNTLF